jgi:hypothetical protein
MGAVPAPSGRFKSPPGLPPAVPRARLSPVTVEWLDSVARPGEPRDETIARLLRDVDHQDPVGPSDDLLVRRDVLLHLDDL